MQSLLTLSHYWTCTLLHHLHSLGSITPPAAIIISARIKWGQQPLYYPCTRYRFWRWVDKPMCTNAQCWIQTGNPYVTRLVLNHLICLGPTPCECSTPPPSFSPHPPLPYPVPPPSSSTQPHPNDSDGL